jgi:hypothetical protein
MLISASFKADRMVVGHSSKDHETKSHCDGRYIVVNSIFQKDHKLHSMIIETNNYAYDNVLTYNPHSESKRQLLPVLPHDTLHSHHDYLAGHDQHHS